MKCPAKVLPVFALCVCFSGFCQEFNPEKKKFLDVSGYIKVLQSTYFIEKADSNFSSNLIHNRLNFKLNFSSKCSFRLELRNRIFYGEQLKLTPSFGKMIDQGNNIFKLSHLWVDEQSFMIHSVIDRLLLQYRLKNWDIKMGRQRINWGLNTIWNPNDIFNAYNFLDFDYEERPGTDALRISRYFNGNRCIDLAVKPGKKVNEHIMSARYGFHRWKYDFQLLSGVYHTDFILGGGWAGSISDNGFKGEVTCFVPAIETNNKKISYTFSTMMERTFKNDWYASVGFLYSGNPMGTMAFGNTIYSSNLSVKQLFPFQYNFQTTIVKNLSPITYVNLTSIYSTKDNSLIFFPSFGWSVASNFDLNIIIQSFFAQKDASYRNLASGLFFRGKWNF